MSETVLLHNFSEPKIVSWDFISSKKKNPRKHSVNNKMKKEKNLQSSTVVFYLKKS